MSRWLWVLVGVVLAACGATAPSQRAAVISYTGCGDGFDGEVGAVVVGPGLAVTVAHGVAQADVLEVRWDGESFRATVAAYSGRSDLALVAVPGIEADAVAFGDPTSGTAVAMFGGLSSGASPLVVEDVLTIRIEEVLGSERVERDGVKLRGSAAEGDSGAGVFDGNGSLVGIVFAVSDDGSGEVWATAATEITPLLADGDGKWRCDPSRSRLVQADQG